MTPATIHDRHMEAIVARLEERAVPLEDTCGFWADGDRCGEPSADVLWFVYGDDLLDPHLGACDVHLAEWCRDHLLPMPVTS